MDIDQQVLSRYITKRRTAVNRFLRAYLPAASCNPSLLHKAMRYSLFAGGKRIRPILCLAACEAVGGKPEIALPAAAAIELVHTYSLIHDDLPAMDNDDYRRGKPTNHKMFGDATAILAGDALLTAAFTLIAGQEMANSVTHKTRLSVISELGTAAGSLGMVGGQLADIAHNGQKPTFKQVQYIHTHKTGALIRASIRIGALLGGGVTEMAALTRYGEKIGLAFQIVDDVLDAKGTHNTDWTYPGVIGLRASEAEAGRLYQEALHDIKPLGPAAEPLRQLAAFVVERKK